MVRGLYVQRAHLLNVRPMYYDSTPRELILKSSHVVLNYPDLLT